MTALGDCVYHLKQSWSPNNFIVLICDVTMMYTKSIM